MTSRTEILSKNNHEKKTIIEMTPMQYAFYIGQDKVIQILNCIPSEKIGINNKTVEKIIENEMEVFKKTPLYMSIEKRNINMIKALLARTDIDVNKKSSHFIENKKIQKKTALHLATEIGDVEIIRLLLERNDIDIDAIDFKGKKAIDYSKNDEIKQLLSR